MVLSEGGGCKATLAVQCVILAFWFLPGCVSVSTSRDPAESIVAVIAGDSMGSGVVVGPDLVVTAKHVVLAAGPGEITVFGRTAAVWAVHETRDVAVLEVVGLGLPPVAIARGPACAGHADRPPIVSVSLGEFCLAIGYTQDGRLGLPVLMRYHGWVVSRVYRDHIAVNTGLCPGMSGGGVFDERGQLLGVVTGAALHFGSIADSTVLAVPASHVAELIPRRRRKLYDMESEDAIDTQGS